VNFKTEITEGVIWKQLLKFTIPILISNLLQQLYSTVDSVIVGNFIGDEALAAVGSVGSLVNMIVGLFIGISAGASVVIAQYYGAQDVDNVQNSVHSAIAFSLIGGVVMSIVGIIVSPALLRMMNTPENVIGMAITYLQIYFTGMIPALIYNVGAGILRATGDSRRPLYYLMISCVLNILLDLLFVVVFKWGVAGAAVVTTIVQTVSAILVMLNLCSTHDIYRIIPRKIKFHAQMMKRIILIGLPTGFQSVVISVSNVIIQSRINYFGDTAMAAMTSRGKLDGFIYVIMAAVGLAMTTFVGQNYGAKRYDRIKQSVKISMLMTSGITILLSGLLLIFGRQSFYLFTKSEAVIEYGIIMMYIIVPPYWIFTAVEILSGTIRGMGNSIIPMAISIIGLCVFRVIWVAVDMLFWNNLIIVCLCYPVSWAITAAAFMLYYRKIIKRLEQT